MECLITLGGTIGALAILAVLALLGWGLVAWLDGDADASPSRSQPDEETVGARLTQVVRTAPIILDTDPVQTSLEATRQEVEERADAATREVLHDIDETFRRQ